MKLIWKIVIAVIVLSIIGFGIAVYWAYNSMTTIEPLDIITSDSQIEKVEKANKWLAQLQEDDKFNGAVLLVKNDSVLLKNTYGFTDASRKEKLTNQSSFRLASVSKQFTALGIMLLKEQGKLSFDDSITKFLPELPYKNVTVRNLLHHTSGIPDVYMDFPKKYKEEIGEVLTVSKMIELLAKENLPLKNQPNEKHVYNNTGYVLLAGIIEKVSGKSFEDFMKVELFDKLQMKNTRIWNLVSKTKDFSNKTASFENVLGEIIELKPGVLDGVAGDGSVFSSIDDFVIWNQFWYKNALISEETKKEAFTKPILNDGSESNYGFGWVIINEDSHWHNGSWLGAKTIIIRNEKLKNCIVVLDNSDSWNVDTIARELVKVLK
ncbi:serine hydrolase domain-containing protein [Tenacibaculum holothuriorum]|uniref:serine hydrolase domain-containing protein n=1 Tax=Tenacibaculum holothuriorum TaxID=1635173 RepID=UPI000A32355E|nr:serine hydrolase domain-containing protein [Tenacibaculum holothuriorum]